MSKTTFTKTAIKPNLDDRFSLKNFDTAIDQCTIKCINLDCLEFSKTSNSYAAREHWPWLVALRNLFSLLRHYRKPLVCIGLTHERFCSWSMFQAHFARPVHKRVHTAGACSGTREGANERNLVWDSWYSPGEGLGTSSKLNMATSLWSSSKQKKLILLMMIMRMMMMMFEDDSSVSNWKSCQENMGSPVASEKTGERGFLY